MRLIISLYSDYCRAELSTRYDDENAKDTHNFRPFEVCSAASLCSSETIAPQLVSHFARSKISRFYYIAQCQASTAGNPQMSSHSNTGLTNEMQSDFN